MGGSSKAVTVGYKYYLGIHLVLAHKIDALKEVVVDEKTAWTGNATGGTITINSPNLFGGEKREGGVSGDVDILMGDAAQPKNSYLTARLGSNIPAFRGVASLVLKQVYIGLNPYLKRWAFLCTRIQTRTNGAAQWYSSKAAIGNDMNPAHIIRECLTDPAWGMGYPDADIDSDSFTAAADTLHSEGMGISIIWDKAKDMEAFLQDILRHIQGTLYVSHTNGKFTLKLTREDYTVGSLPRLDEDSVTRVSDFKRRANGEAVNSVTVVFWDATTRKNNSVTVQDIALIASQGATIGTTKQYPGFTNGANAVKAASRDLQALSSALASCTLYCTRKAYSLSVGDAFILSWPRLGIQESIMRVTGIEFGTLDNNQIKIDCVEDVFSAGSAVYANPPPTAWVNPASDPAVCPFHFTMEAPYWELVQATGETTARNTDANSGYAVVSGVRPSEDAVSAELFTDPDLNNSFDPAGTVDFCPTALLSASVSKTDTVFPYSSGIDVDLARVGSYATIGNEIVSVVSVGPTSITVGRGVLDTVPLAHASGTRMFFPDDFVATDGIEYAISDEVRLRVCPSTAKGTLPVGSATTVGPAIVGRHYKPYPPGKFRINSSTYPASASGVVTVSWAHRDRLTQTVGLVDQNSDNIGPEAGTTYTARMLRADNSAVLATSSGVAGTSTTLSAAYTGNVIIELWSTRGGVDSLYRHSHTLSYAP